MPPPHTSFLLSKKLNGFLCESKLEIKVFSITLDNTTNNHVSIEILQIQLNHKGLLVCEGEQFHLRCYASILNLVVYEGMKQLYPCIVKIREIWGMMVTREVYAKMCYFLSYYIPTLELSDSNYKHCPSRKE
ncbi:Ribonuclease H-like domain containing protein [Trema orientale]|uniref:Ribonuclease H-like domain containing protein n=1 Tax=Trema orientale TaxID=63057 RepID=A0A2P5C4A4_TREOI|nr:Ribonuclease H-like domain containing protein [Trema orientale]